MRSASRLLSFLVVLCFLAAFSTTTFAKSAASPQVDNGATAPSRVTQAIDDNNTMRLAGNTRPEAILANDRGPVPDGYDFDHILLVLQRSPEQEQELKTLIESLNDRNSPNFHHWMTPEEFGRYGVAQEDIDKVTGWLESNGFRVNTVYANHMMIDFSGSAASVRTAFHTSMHYLEVRGEQHISNVGDPWVPAALAPVVKGTFSLNDFKPHPMYRSKTDYTFGGCASSADVPTEPGTCYAVTPQDNAVIYNLNPLWSAGVTGQGQTIALVEDTDTYTPSGGTFASDWNTYVTTFGLSGYGGTYTEAHPGGCADPGSNADDGEAAIDVEMASSFAPGASIQLISCGSGSFTFGGVLALSNLVNASGPYPNVVSMSYGLCEAGTGNGANAYFYNTFEQTAAQGISAFVSSGDEGPSSCSSLFGTDYDVTTLGVTGWGESPYNVSVGGTDFEDVYNLKAAANGGAPLSTYWSSTNSATYGSALSYIPEMPWDDSCANVLISEVANNTFTTYGSTGTCNKSPFNTTSGYESPGAGSGGASNCATGNGGASQTSAAVSDAYCQGYPKPSYQAGSSLSGGQAVYGMPNDGLRDIPDVSMFAANGVWGHFETVCWSDPTQTSGGAVSCSGAPSTWSGFGGTSVAAPSLAGIQALVNQKTGENWGNPNPIYYQIAQNEYGTAGGSFLGGSCNSSNGSGNSCVFNDITQGDIDVGCEDDGTTAESHCYKPSGTFGVDSTDVISGTVIVSGGVGYTSAPTCTVAGPTNSNPYKTPAGATLFAGGTQATCTAAFASGSTSATYTIKFIASGSTINTDYPNQLGFNIGGVTYTFVTSLTGAPANSVLLVTSGSTGTQETDNAKNLEAAINATSSQCTTAPCFSTGTTANPVATATESTSTVTTTAKTAGYAGNFSVSLASTNVFFQALEVVTISQTATGAGPGYVSAITVAAGSSGYGPQTPITLTGGGGSGAIAVANTTAGTASSSYQPSYGAAPGYDMATGLGSVNAYNMVNNCVWSSSCQTITFTTNAPASAADGSNFTVAATATSGLAVTFTSSGYCSNAGATYTMTSGSGTCSVIANQAGNSSYSAAPTVTETTNATKAATSIAVSSVSPSSEDYGSTSPVTITAVLSWSGSSSAPTASDVIIGGNGAGSYSATSCGPASGDTLTCNATYSPTGTELPGSYNETAAFSGDSNYTASSSTQTGNFTINAATSTTTVGSTPNPSTYAQQVVFTATINGENNFTKIPPGKNGRNKRVALNPDVTGTVAWSANTGCGTTAVTSGNPGIATCTTSAATHLPVGNDTVTAAYSGDSNHSGSTGSVVQVVQGGIATTINVTNVNPTNEDFAADTPVAITAVLSWTGHGAAPTASDVTIGGTGNGTYGATSCSPRSGDTITCQATYTPTNADVAGSYTETATFSGDTNYSGSTSPQTGNFTINAATSTTVVTTSGSPSTFGQSVTFTAAVSGENNFVKGGKKGMRGQDVTGTVAWSSNTGCGTTAVTSGNPGTATCTTTTLPGGTDTISATYSGDSNHGGSTGSFNQVVNPASQTITFSQNAPASAVYNSSFTVAANASSGLAVTYASSGSCGNAGATYTMTSGTGACSVTANQPGNSDYAAATPVTESVNATKASQSIAVTTPAPATATLKSSFTVVATAPSGTVTFGSAGGCTNAGGTYTMASSGKVACTETMNAAANSNYAAAAQVTETTTVAAAIPPTVSFTGAPTSAPYQSTFSVTATTNAGVAATITSTGPCTVSGTTVTMTSGAGTCALKASWPATDVYKAATATQRTTAEKIAPTVTFTGAPGSAAYLSTFPVTTTTNDGVTPTITSTTGTVCSVSSGVVTMKNGTGTCTVRALWAANSDYLAATLEQSTTATMLNTTTTITNTVAGTNPLRVTVSFTVSNGTATAVAGNVTVNAASGQSCTGTVASGKCVLTFTAAETTTLTAGYAGNSDNNPSSSASFPLTVY